MVEGTKEVEVGGSREKWRGGWREGKGRGQGKKGSEGKGLKKTLVWSAAPRVLLV